MAKQRQDWENECPKEVKTVITILLVIYAIVQSIIILS